MSHLAPLAPPTGHPAGGVYWPRLGRRSGVEHGPLLPRESEVSGPRATGICRDCGEFNRTGELVLREVNPSALGRPLAYTRG